MKVSGGRTLQRLADTDTLKGTCWHIPRSSKETGAAGAE